LENRAFVAPVVFLLSHQRKAVGQSWSARGFPSESRMAVKKKRRKKKRRKRKKKRKKKIIYRAVVVGVNYPRPQLCRSYAQETDSAMNNFGSRWKMRGR
jgi:hypothetical protein